MKYKSVFNPFILSSTGILLDDITTRIGVTNNIPEAWPITQIGMFIYGQQEYVTIRTLVGLSLVLGIGYALYLLDKYKTEKHKDRNIRYTHKLFLYSIGILEFLTSLNNAYYIINNLH